MTRRLVLIGLLCGCGTGAGPAFNRAGLLGAGPFTLDASALDGPDDLT